jgi:hypothetical protein
MLVATKESPTLGSVEEDMAREPGAIAELRRSLGSQLATFRLAADLTQGRLAKLTYCDRTRIVHIEKGRARADERFWRAADLACAAEGALVAAYLELEAAKAEYERREREQRLARVRAKAAALRGQTAPANTASDVPGAAAPSLESLRQSVLGHAESHEASGEVNPSHFHSGVVEAHRLYQRADYDGAARILPSLIGRLECSTASTIPAHTKSAAYLAAAKLATKVGDFGLAWVTADRGLRFAKNTVRHGLIGIASYQVACALLGNGHLTDAEETATQAADLLASQTKTSIRDVTSARGALLLLLAVMAGRRGDAQAAKRNLRGAARLSDQLGPDGNVLWTAFGPTNIAIHQLAVHVALKDSRSALQLGERIDTDALPTVLLGRRSQVHLELGWASVGQGDDSLAVLHLLEAERVAKQAVSRNATARALLGTLLARERKSATPGLRALAARAGAI